MRACGFCKEIDTGNFGFTFCKKLRRFDMGFVILGALALYALISIFVVVRVISHAKKNGKSSVRWGFGVALVLYLIPFWDWLPTVAMHRYYCATEAGFFVYKNVDQWKAENPGVMEALVANKGAPSRYEIFNDGHGVKDTYMLNDRFHWAITKLDVSSWLPIMRFQQEVLDAKKGTVLARYVDFATGNSIKNTVGPPGPVKFWLHNRHCGGGESNQDALRNFRDFFSGGKL